LQAPFAFFGGLLWNYVDVNKERQNIKKALGYHLPREVVEQIAKDIVQVETEAQVVYGICLFTDVAEYTTLSETLDGPTLYHLLLRLGIPVKLKTRIVYYEDGKVKSLADKLKER
jgi:adenylate cyclase